MDEFRAAIDKEVKLMVGVVLADDFLAKDTDSDTAIPVECIGGVM